MHKTSRIWEKLRIELQKNGNTISLKKFYHQFSQSMRNAVQVNINHIVKGKKLVIAHTFTRIQPNYGQILIQIAQKPL